MQMLHETVGPPRCGSVGTMKHPRLPGAEKFRFSTPFIGSHTSGVLCNDSLTKVNACPAIQEIDNHSPKLLRHVRSSTRYSQSDLSPLICTLSVPSLNRSDSRRKAVLPITCKKTSRMLNNTNLELNVDHAELIAEDGIKNNRLDLDSNRIPSCPNLESSRSLNSSKTSLDAYFRKLSLQNPPIRENPTDWMNIRVSPSRLSASCSSSCSSEENVWVLREAMR